MVPIIFQKMILYFGQDKRRINHALKVYGFAQAIASFEALDDEQRFIVQLAALLHDIGIKEAEQKYQSSGGHYQELEGPPIAREILESAGIESSVIERVCYLIGHHHSYHMIDGIDFQILVEADFLVNIDEDGFNGDMINSVKRKYFKTRGGITLLESIYKI